MTKKALVLSDTKIMTFNSNNIWVDTGLSLGSLTNQNFIDSGFDPSILTTSLTNIYVNFTDMGPLGTEGGELWLSEDIDKNLGVTAMEYIDSDTAPKIKLTIPAFLPKDSLKTTDKLLIYNDDAAYIPEIMPPSFSANTTHTASIIMSSSVQYNYNKQIIYRIKIGTSYTSSWSSPQISYEPISVEILAKDLSIGSNTITLEVADAADNTKVNSVSLSNAITLNDSAPEVAIVTAESNNFKVHFIITDPDAGDRVQYQLTLMNSLIGSVVVRPWTTLSNPPVDITYQFDSNQVAVNQTNTLKIDYKDNYGVTGSSSYTFIGEYKNILFIDEQGEFLTSDKGMMIKMLHFGQLIGGRTSEVKKITIKNNNGYDISDISISKISITNLPGIELELSKTNNPFTPLEKLDYGTQELAFKDTIDFYARIKAADTSVGLNKFEIDVFALPASK